MVTIVLAKWRELLQPFVDVLYEAGFVVVYIDGSGDVHGGDERQSFLHAALAHGGFYLRRDVNVVAMFLGVELQVFGVCLHGQQHSRRANATVTLTRHGGSFRLTSCPLVRSLSER